MATFYRFDSASTLLVTTATNRANLKSLSGRLIGLRLEDDQGAERLSIPPHKRLLVELDSGIIAVRLFRLSDPEDQRSCLDPFADRVLLTLASLQCLQQCVATFVTYKGVTFPAMCDQIGRAHV